MRAASQSSHPALPVPTPGDCHGCVDPAGPACSDGVLSIRSRPATERGRLLGTLGEKLGLRYTAGDRWEGLAELWTRADRDGDPWEGFLSVVGPIRIVIAACAVAVMWALPAARSSPRVAFTALVVLVYLPYTWVARRIAFRPFGY